MGGLDRTGQGISEWKSFDEAVLQVFSLLSDLLVRCKGSSPSGADTCFCCPTGAVKPQPGWSNQISHSNSNSESK
jgi:hypothetical protein